MSTLLEQYLKVDQEVKTLEALKNQLREQIGDLPLGPVPINDDFRFAVTETRRFDPAVAKDLMTEDEYKRSLKTTLDGSLVKQVVSPEVYNLMMTVSGQTWKVVKRDD